MVNGAEREVRALRVEGLVNARDLGGLPRQNGTLTPRGVFFRSENVDSVTPAGWDQIREAGIRTIVDLRQAEEQAQDTQTRPAWLTTVTVDLDGLDDADFWKDFWSNGFSGTALYFLPHLHAMPERSVAVLSALASALEGGVLFHCMGGRDRTGLIAMLLLAAIDTEPDAIVDDYLETVRLADRRAATSKRNNAEPEIDALCQTFGTTTEGAFRSALLGLDLVTLLVSPELKEANRAAVTNWRGSV
ncbi:MULTISPECIES: tyrosine-protein phosphatase [Cryobacterium]|uniref:Tyrosine-protein phosphatase n=1 Tax=Cryobacterium breve TaxID=1259258 RepID=A0ABY2IYK4_9MICO|nr:MULTISPECIES: tyrosine-protein phosphatase [Cryobacterium]TFC96731.1 tyrosine-protein phosphatase [Cryobacterium sp. TmT3-12]TFC97472.1 tyrosine-protein phosphatase [Cryobacterium breve]